MTPAELDALADKATPGPWTVEEDEFGLYIEDGSPDDGYIVHFTHHDRSDANLIALAPTLAREHAALLRWAAKARDEIEREAEIANEHAADWMIAHRIAKRLDALLAEYDERWSS